MTLQTGHKIARGGGRITFPVAHELQGQAAALAHFRTTRSQHDAEIIAQTTVPDAALLQRVCACIKAPARRIPLTTAEATRARALVQLVEAAAAKKDPDAYSRAFAAAALYLILPQIDAAPLPELLQPWLAQILSAAVADGALVGVGDNDTTTLTAMRWCMDFARTMQAAQERGALIGDAAWTTQWLPLLGFDITTLNFYSTYTNLKECVTLFGRLRAQAFAVTPPLSDGHALRTIGEIPARPARDPRWRIALFCTHPTAHGHGLPHFIWWLACLDRTRFEPILVLRHTPDNILGIENCLRHYPVLAEYAPIILVDDGSLPQLARFDFDLLYNFDDLCRGRSERPGYLRLARNQVTAFYTPATTGCPEMDYFITAPDLDPKTQNAFTEQVVLSDGLPFCFHYEGYFGITPLQTNRDDDIPADAVIYTMGASMLTKLRPEFLDAVLEILKRTPGSYCVAMPATPIEGRQHLSDLIVRRCAAAGIDPQRFRFGAVVNRALLHGMIGYSDVFLDFFPFSGTNNILDPIAVGTPCVTLCPPDGFSRNRIAGAIMRAHGLGALVATTPAEYVELAVKLGTNRALRQAYQAKIGRAAVENGPLCDGPAFVARMEKVMTDILSVETKKAAHA